jgi:hypothetical protein
VNLPRLLARQFVGCEPPALHVVILVDLVLLAHDRFQ